MKKMVILTGLLIILLITACLQFKNNAATEDPRGSAYAGSDACAKCHGNLYNSYIHTAHYFASLPATDSTVHGSFAKDANQFKVSDAKKIVMEKLDSGLFQTYYLNEKVKDRYRFDIVFGAVKGESYLYWKGNELYQLPLSYFTRQHQWSTSPGYALNGLDNSHLRSIGKQCLECHASYIDNVPGESPELTKAEQFNKNSLVYHIDCERCHGPGKQHVDFQTENPDIKTAKFITGFSSLNRGQKIDLCAVCHSGYPSFRLRSSFEFVPGNRLTAFKMPEFYHRIDSSVLDVHGNQVQLLQSSKCYINSNMDCATCHDTHQNTRGKDALYAEKCLNCHNTANQSHCKMTDKLSAVMLKTNCINCHMPALPSKAISVQVSDQMQPIQFLVHTHHIAGYPEEVKKILAYINK